MEGRRFPRGHMLILLGMACASGASEPNQPVSYVSRQEFEALKQELTDLKRQAATTEKEAESSGLGDTKLLIAGDVNAGYVHQEHGDNTFFAEFSPMFLWQLNERLLFHGDWDFDLSGPELDGEGAQTDVELGAAFLTYLLTDSALAGLGAFATGAFPWRREQFNYAVWVTNGPALITTGADAGRLNFANYNDTNSGKAVGGRLGWLPIPQVRVALSF